MAWTTIILDASVDLTVGQEFTLTFSAPADTTYSVPAMHDGSRYYGFDERIVFSDGLAQMTTGADWTGWTANGLTNVQSADLQFYFDVDP